MAVRNIINASTCARSWTLAPDTRQCDCTASELLVSGHGKRPGKFRAPPKFRGGGKSKFHRQCRESSALRPADNLENRRAVLRGRGVVVIANAKRDRMGVPIFPRRHPRARGAYHGRIFDAVEVARNVAVRRKEPARRWRAQIDWTWHRRRNESSRLWSRPQSILRTSEEMPAGIGSGRRK